MKKGHLTPIHDAFECRDVNLREAHLAAGLLFAAGVLVTLVFTAMGVQWLAQQMAVAHGFKSGLVTFILGLGLVLVGPVLLAAMAITFPRGWLRVLKYRVTMMVRRLYKI